MCGTEGAEQSDEAILKVHSKNRHRVTAPRPQDEPQGVSTQLVAVFQADSKLAFSGA